MSDNATITTSKTIIIYLHMAFDLSNGGVTVQYYLAYILNSFGIDVKICNIHDNNKENSIYNNFITPSEFKNNYNNNNTIVIYCEGIIGNPLSAKYVVRWLLSKLGQNVPINYYLSWGPNDLVYFFNSENELVDYNIPHKKLTILYVNPIFTDLDQPRESMCFTKRKNIILTSHIMHTNDAFEVTRKHTQDEYLYIFNKFEKFISYDPISFLTVIAALCGCISVVYPIPNLSKKDYFKMTAFYDYMVENNLNSIYGIAYGNTENEINYARNTLPFIEQQINDIQKWFIKKYVNNFILDIDNWSSNTNTLINYIKNKNLSLDFLYGFDINTYRNSLKGFELYSDAELLNHYISSYKPKHISPVSIRTNLNQNNQLDLRFYRSYYKDLQYMTNYELQQHYINFGIKEGRFSNRKQYEDSYNK
jgi:hypothetical protein